MNFGTGADGTADPVTLIYGRSVGTDTASAAARVSAAPTAPAQFVASPRTHCPGHGAAPGASPRGSPRTALG
ncbi:glycoside hydrolase family 3 protein, partial [Microbacterium oxydans]|nr:glycoside hydrolase family 3 protein [Microbacterium oxydans]